MKYKAILEKKDNKYHLVIEEWKKKWFWSSHRWHFHKSIKTNSLNTIIKEASENEHLIPNLKGMVISLWDEKK